MLHIVYLELPVEFESLVLPNGILIINILLEKKALTSRC